MGTGAITGYIDVAQLALYAFWIFFFGLVIYLQREGQREGYPLEAEHPGGPKGELFPSPEPKSFLLHDGRTVTVPLVKTLSGSGTRWSPLTALQARQA